MMTAKEETKIEAISDIENVFEIPLVNLDGFLNSIKKLQKRADKLEFARIKVIIGETIIKHKTMEGGIREKIPYVSVFVNGTAPIIDGWMFVAALEFSTEFGMLVKKIPNIDETIPEHYLIDDGDAYLCEHCEHKRKRNKAYIVINIETGEWKQVGSSCVKDFTGHVSPAKLASYWKMLQQVEEYYDESERMSREETGIHGLVYYLSHVSAITNKIGYISKSKANEDGSVPTVRLIEKWFDYIQQDMQRDEFFEKLSVEPSDVEVAEKVIEYMTNLDDDVCRKNEFMMNLRSIAKAGTVPMYHTGFVACMISVYERNNKKNIEIDGTEFYPAEVNTKISVNNVILADKSHFNGQFGPSTVYTFKKDKMVFTWFTSSSKNKIEIGDVYNIRGTIKKLQEYRGIKQTVLGRVKVDVI